MKIEIRYQSKTGNTKKIADAIGEELGVEPMPITEKLKHNIDILFLGGAVYGFDIDEEMKQFIKNIDIEIKKVFIFSTSMGTKIPYKKMEKCLNDKNIPVEKENFYCKGKFGIFNKNRPDNNDLLKAKEFAKDIVK